MLRSLCRIPGALSNTRDVRIVQSCQPEHSVYSLRRDVSRTVLNFGSGLDFARGLAPKEDMYHLHHAPEDPMLYQRHHMPDAQSRHRRSEEGAGILHCWCGEECFRRGYC